MPILPPKKPVITLGTQGPHLLGRDLGLFKCIVPLDKLDTHFYIVRKLGQGKNKFLEGLIWQFITLSQGCGVIVPHGDLANNTLKLKGNRILQLSS